MQGRNETTEQQAVMEWATIMRNRWPCLENLYHVPNEAKRSAATAGTLKRMGMKAGVPDLILDHPAGCYHGLRIEMKWDANKPTREQIDWLLRLQAEGYAVACCWSAQLAIALLSEYITLKPGQRLKADSPEIKTRWGFPTLK